MVLRGVDRIVREEEKERERERERERDEDREFRGTGEQAALSSGTTRECTEP